MRAMKGVLLAVAVISTAAAQGPEPPIADTRLTVHTLLREDIFAGFLDNNMERMARGEKNVDALLQQRPDQKGNLLAWKGGIALHKAVRAHDAGDAAGFDRHFADARGLFGDAMKLSDGNGGVIPVVGGSYAVFADRLPQEHRAAAWQQAYEMYSALYKAQAEKLDQMPLHFKGEVLAGMAQSAQRTGRAAESAQFVDRMTTSLAGTPFEKTARQWKEDPSSAAASSLTCKNCHAPGRLSARLAALNK
jgi:hypothetical protein